VSVFDHGLLYGDGVFEGLRFYRGVPFRIDRHLRRLRRSLAAIRLQIPYSDVQLREGINHCIEAFGEQSGYLRLVATRGEGGMGLNPKHCRTPNVFAIACQLELVSEEAITRGLTLVTTTTRRMLGSGLDSRVKSLNYLHSILAKTEANAANADEAVMLNQFGRVAECSAANIFIVRDGQLLTPPCSDGALEGITREAVMEIALANKLVVRETSLNPWDLVNADECFISGSGARLVPVSSVDGCSLPTHHRPVFELIRSEFYKLIDRECGA